METEKVYCLGCQKEEFIKITTFVLNKYTEGFWDMIYEKKIKIGLQSSHYYACRTCGLKFDPNDKHIFERF